REVWCVGFRLIHIGLRFHSTYVVSAFERNFSTPFKRTLCAGRKIRRQRSLTRSSMRQTETSKPDRNASTTRHQQCSRRDRRVRRLRKTIRRRSLGSQPTRNLLRASCQPSGTFPEIHRRG